MKTKKIMICTILVIILMTTFMHNKVYAEDDLFQKMQKQATQWMKKGRDTGQDVLKDDNGNEILENKFIPIGQVLITIASVVLVVVTLIMSIKYLTANAEQKGKLKQQLIGLVVSIVVIYGAVGIWSLIKDFMEGLNL